MKESEKRVLDDHEIHPTTIRQIVGADPADLETALGQHIAGKLPHAVVTYLPRLAALCEAPDAPIIVLPFFEEEPWEAEHPETTFSRWLLTLPHTPAGEPLGQAALIPMGEVRWHPGLARQCPDTDPVLFNAGRDGHRHVEDVHVARALHI